MEEEVVQRVAASTPHVQLDGISKRFGGVRALDGVSLSVRRATIHALVGENGAGKSTLGRILAGVVQPDAGTLRVGGRAVEFGSPRAALEAGVTLISQEIALVPSCTVVENVFLGRERSRLGLVDEDALARAYEELDARVGFGLPGGARVGALRLADQQKVEILRAIARGVELIVMDEPTAALTAEEAQRLFEIAHELRERGTTIVYVSHFLDEVLRLADDVTILKDGRLVRSAPAAEETPASLIEGMLGRALDVTFPPKTPPSGDAPVRLRVRDLCRGQAVRSVSFDVRAGEILGIAGLVGSGRSETARLIFGADRCDAGRVEVDGRPVRIRSPRDAMRAGIALLPESRKDDGLVLGRSVAENVTLPHLSTVSAAGLLRTGRERRTVGEALQRVVVDPARAPLGVATLSGGNQQKVLFAKWLLRMPRVLIADEPTRGVDVGAKLAIYELLAGLAAEGLAIVVISSELEEVMGLADRILVMRGGAVVSEHEAGGASERELMNAAFGAPLRQEAEL